MVQLLPGWSGSFFETFVVLVVMNMMLWTEESVAHAISQPLEVSIVVSRSQGQGLHFSFYFTALLKTESTIFSSWRQTLNRIFISTV